MRSYLSVSAMAGGLLLVATAASAGQQPPPIGGLTGTIGAEGTVQQPYAGIHTLIVKTVGGIGHLFHWSRRTEAHEGAVASDRALRGFDSGSKVVVRDRVAGAGADDIEGVVTTVDRSAKTIAVRLADGSEQTLRLAGRAASGAGDEIDAFDAGTARVVVYVSDEAGGQVAHYFTRVS
jgi:hypothetical protein